LGNYENVILNFFQDLIYAIILKKYSSSKIIAIPAKAGIQCFHAILDAPVSKYGAGSSSPA
jgi:hypothetical protein